MIAHQEQLRAAVASLEEAVFDTETRLRAQCPDVSPYWVTDPGGRPILGDMLASLVAGLVALVALERSA